MKRRIIDFHTHAFPDFLADRAMAQLHSECDIQSYLDGRVSSLLRSMDEAGIEKSVLCNIATRPSQFDSILEWSCRIRSERIIPLPSVHPDAPNLPDKIGLIAEKGFIGVKMHPYYQSMVIDEPRHDLLYKSIIENDLILVLHTGYDIAFPREERANPKQILHVLDRFGELKLITTHMGAWYQWDEVEQHLLGKPIYIETSVSLEYMGAEKMKRMLENHNPDYLLFGTDSPWDDQKKAVISIENLISDETLKRKIFYENAARLLESANF
ncbi:MAG TPA: TatD family hydrolase [Anaerohalosphaeraceae bacterium]|nr:TatD family hydrolase [Anaerohalosphaeraceae bacterium]HQG05614.1 TatD family hydrolase [Anaerohalosphaeraceae bacterium]HQI07330.1 TatD family hydrolase [Anaerohalosphaeraceae bacterium]HQJ67562.1 TatD family hydrolase [Anaerohalosphaeraceae bacterium]